MGSIMVVVTAINVFTRYLFNYSIIWSNELARYMFVWITFLGGSVVLKRSELARMTALLGKMPRCLQKVVIAVIEILVIFFSIYAAKYGWIQAVNVKAQLSPAMHVSMFWVYISVPVGFVIMIIHSFNRLLMSLSKGGIS